MFPFSDFTQTGYRLHPAAVCCRPLHLRTKHHTSTPSIVLLVSAMQRGMITAVQSGNDVLTPHLTRQATSIISKLLYRCLKNATYQQQVTDEELRTQTKLLDYINFNIQFPSVTSNINKTPTGTKTATRSFDHHAFLKMLRCLRGPC
jgi:hypothetical protein